MTSHAQLSRFFAPKTDVQDKETHLFWGSGPKYALWWLILTS